MCTPDISYIEVLQEKVLTLCYDIPFTCSVLKFSSTKCGTKNILER